MRIDIDKNIFNDYNTLRGLGTVFEQMQLLYERINQGEFKKLIKYRDSDNNIRLKPDKKLLHDFYASIIGSFQADTLIELTLKQELSENQTDTASTYKQTDRPESIVDYEENKFIKNVHPNPTKDFCTVELYKTDQFHFDIVDNSGKLVRRGQIINQTEKIDLTGFETGIYFLRVYTADKNYYETINITKKE